MPEERKYSGFEKLMQLDQQRADERKKKKDEVGAVSAVKAPDAVRAVESIEADRAANAPNALRAANSANALDSGQLEQSTRKSSNRRHNRPRLRCATSRKLQTR